VDLASCDELLTTTRAVRHRLDLTRPVAREVINDCLRLAVQAPTGGHSEQWRWLVLDDPDRRARVAELYAEGRHILEESAARATREKARRAYEGALYLLSVLDQVPVHVIPCVRGRIADGNVLVAASLFGSVLPAVWSFMLALRSRGLGSTWTTLHLAKEAEVADLLGIPEDYMQVALIPVAYTTSATFRPATRRPIDEVTYWNAWNGTSSHLNGG
jgi:nitroreductase